MRPFPSPGALRVLAESLTPREEAEDTRPRTVRTPRRQAGSPGVSEARLVPHFPARPTSLTPGSSVVAALPPPGLAPLEGRGSREGARAGDEGQNFGASGTEPRGGRGSRPLRRPRAPGVPNKVPALRAGPPRSQVGGGEGRVREPRGAHSARLGHPPGGRWQRGPGRARAPPEGVPRALRGGARGAGVATAASYPIPARRC